jgi:hypothetical protein
MSERCNPEIRSGLVVDEQLKTPVPIIVGISSKAGKGLIGGGTPTRDALAYL